MQFAEGVSEETTQLIRDFFAELDKAGPNVICPYEYAKYLQSKKWKRIRRRVLKRDGRLFRRCGGRATLVHHRSYAPEVLAGDNDEQLASLCEGCHTVIHYDEFGAKRTPEETDRLLLRSATTLISPPRKSTCAEIGRSRRRSGPA
jgi:hypothetical protein